MGADAAHAHGAGRREMIRFLAALRYFTRLPLPGRAGVAPEALAGAIGYLPLIGLIVGATGAGVYLMARIALPDTVAVILSMAVTVLVTGALHEDGLADAADGLGGGLDRARALEIMKDPHVGAFGAISLILALLLKYNLLLAVPATGLPAVLIAGHAVSRLAAVCVQATLPYVRDAQGSRAGSLTGRISMPRLGVAVLAGLAPLALLGKAGLIGLGCLAPTGVAWRAYLQHRLGGYTGDCLGATQQLCEIAFYVGAVASR